MIGRKAKFRGKLNDVIVYCIKHKNLQLNRRRDCKDIISSIAKYKIHMYNQL